MTKLLSFDKTTILNYLFVLYALCIPLSRAGIVFSSSMIILFWIFEGDFKNKFKNIISNKFILLSLLLTFYLMLSVFWSENSSYDFYHFKRFWYYLPMFAIFTSLKKEFIIYIISAFIFSMMISEILSYGMFFELWHLKHGTSADPTPFMNHLEYSLFLAFTSSYLLIKFFLEKEYNKNKILYMVFFITASTNLFLTGGRTGQLAFVFSIFVIIMSHIKNKIKAFIISMVLLSSILFSAYTFSDTFNQRCNAAIHDLNNAYNNGNFSGSWGLRLSTWVVTKNILSKNLFIGTGIADIQNDYVELIEVKKILKVDNTSAMKNGGYHNDFLELSAGGGIIASILFILAFISFAKTKCSSEEINNIKILLLSVFIISIISDNFFRLQFTMNLFSLFAGIVLANKNISEKAIK